jgi:hypothetical protein
MKGQWKAASFVTALLLGACSGETTMSPNGNDPVSADPYAPCTDVSKCCPKERLVCKGNPDGTMVCGCSDLWDCSKNPKKCTATQGAPHPPGGGGGWECTWSEFSYSCTKTTTPGQPGENPSGGGDWQCTWMDKEFTWVCEKTGNIPTPPNTPMGVGGWTCEVVENNLVCTRKDNGAPPVGGGEWECKTENGKTVCQKTDNPGLPTGGGGWTCNKTVDNGITTWVCYGTSSTPPGGGNWECTQVNGEFNTWKCERPEEGGDTPPQDKNPPGGGWWSCVMGSEFSGERCGAVSQPPNPPTPTPNEDEKCLINETRWCDGLQYCGWGQVKCDPATNTWATKIVNGVKMLDCQELGDGRRPNTVCACFHFYYNPSCCERPDCIVPAGSNGQLCPPSKGGLCDYCNPQKDGECKEPGGTCIVTNSHETFCAKECSGASDCPADYNCQEVTLQNGSTFQCIPMDFSCYY